MKWKHVKGWMGLMLAAMMAVTGCGSSNTTETPSDSASSEAAVQTESSSEAVTEETEEAKLDYVKLKGITIGDPGEAADVWLEKTNEMLLRDLNCELEMEYISCGSGDEGCVL